MKKIFPALLFIITLSVQAQNYQANWQSLDSRPVPQWFKDAKFGIFIHWGVYAVPGWCPKGNYAEWYQYGLQTTDSARMKYHQEKFGNLTYYQLADQFKAELFNPDEWARLFEQSGARYIVLTSKHHDGFCLWPSKEANRDWHFPWNAADVGPKRDLLGDLFKAVRKTSVHPGMYYSLYEWFNPLWKSDPKKYATEHAWPQMKDLINTYQPDVFWTDGDWEVSDEVWKSKEFLAWMYNESPVKDRVVTYDRWGSNVRFKHGAVFTPEYQPDLDFEDHYWEESRGMGYSYGYNRGEDAWDYNSAQSLVLHLVDKVSRGGNFLLDIGPDEHGKIPPIMQERLLQMGEWLKINGEAIYGTSRWKVASQWSEGRKDYVAKGGDVMLKLAVDPDPGYARKEIFYTYNATANNLYAILPVYPSNHIVLIKDVELPAATKISLLATGDPLTWQQQGNNVAIHLPDYDPNKIKAPYAYVVKMENYGKFVPHPHIDISYAAGSLQPLIAIRNEPGTIVYYTTDGSEPTASANLYSQPFTLDHTATVTAKAFHDGQLPSGSAIEKAITYKWMPAVKADGKKPGVTYKYFEPSDHISMESFFNGPVKGTGVAKQFSLAPKQRAEKFGLDFYGYIKIDAEDIYTFFTNSDDGSKLLIDGVEVVDNDGEHGATEKEGRAALRKGYHTIRVMYFDSGGDNTLQVYWQAGKGPRQEIPAGMLYH